MAISPSTIWRIRIGGSNLSSGCFDPSVAGAGTDYTEQDAPQLALTDLASATPYTTVTSAVGGFTTAMIGNGIYIASGTGFTAGRYIVTGVTDTNTALLDRACAVSAASAGVAKLGGALATLNALAGIGATAGNVIFVRGQGSNEPIDIDYNITIFGLPATVALIGYNGRPKIGHNGYGISVSTRSRIENLHFVVTSAVQVAYGAVHSSNSGSVLVHNCVFDSSGWDVTQVSNVSVSRCSFINTGVQSLGTRPALVITSGSYNTLVKDSLFKDQRFSGCDVAMGNTVLNCVFQNNGGDGLVLGGSLASSHGPWLIANNTFHDNAGHGINLAAGNVNITGNIFSNHTTSGKYGLYIADGISSATHWHSGASLAENNFYGNTDNCNVTLNSSNLTLDPTFVDAPVDLTPTNTALRVIGGVGSL